MGCASSSAARVQELETEVAALRAKLLAHGLAVDHDGDGKADFAPDAQFMANAERPDVILTTACEEAAADEHDEAIVFTSYKMKPKGAEGLWRNEHFLQCQMARWHWVQHHPVRWINMLRRAGFPDEDIDMCNARTKPLDFYSLADYEECKEDLRAAAKAIETRCGVKAAHFVQQGSSCTGFSTNPFKGLRFIPTHIYHDDSDTDFRLIGEGMRQAVDAAAKGGVHVIERPGAGVLKPSNGPEIFPELRAVSDKWSPRVRGKSSQMQFTIVIDPDSAAARPKLWDLPVPPKKTEPAQSV